MKRYAPPAPVDDPDRAPIRQLLAEAKAEMKMVCDGDYGSREPGKYANGYERYLNGVIDTLRWVLGEAPASPVLGVPGFDPTNNIQVAHDFYKAEELISDIRGIVPEGWDGEFLTGAYRTLSWLMGGDVRAYGEPLAYT